MTNFTPARFSSAACPSASLTKKPSLKKPCRLSRIADGDTVKVHPTLLLVFEGHCSDPVRCRKEFGRERGEHEQVQTALLASCSSSAANSEPPSSCTARIGKGMRCCKVCDVL